MNLSDPENFPFPLLFRWQLCGTRKGGRISGVIRPPPKLSNGVYNASKQTDKKLLFFFTVLCPPPCHLVCVPWSPPVHLTIHLLVQFFPPCPPQCLPCPPPCPPQCPPCPPQCSTCPPSCLFLVQFLQVNVQSRNFPAELHQHPVKYLQKLVLNVFISEM